MNNYPKIMIWNERTNHHFKGYLVLDKKTKFIALNESKKIELHFPKAAYCYKLSETK